jgi:uncharacterized short protein YbdD (DUF466 family)
MNSPLHAFWNFVRQVTGDDAYERYLAHHRAQHPDVRPMTRREFFRRRQDEKWSKVSRCC